MQIFVPNNNPDEQGPECQAHERAEAARGGEVAQGDT